jgi:hypothetical protein
MPADQIRKARVLGAHGTGNGVPELAVGGERRGERREHLPQVDEGALGKSEQGSGEGDQGPAPEPEPVQLSDLPAPADTPVWVAEREEQGHHQGCHRQHRVELEACCDSNRRSREPEPAPREQIGARRVKEDRDGIGVAALEREHEGVLKQQEHAEDRNLVALSVSLRERLTNDPAGPDVEDRAERDVEAYRPDVHRRLEREPAHPEEEMEEERRVIERPAPDVAAPSAVDEIRRSLVGAAHVRVDVLQIRAPRQHERKAGERRQRGDQEPDQKQELRATVQRK